MKVKNNLAVLLTALMAFVGILTETSLNVTFPTLMRQFRVNLATVQWMTTGYLLMISIVMITTSYLNRRFSAKSQFIFASLGFILGSIICAFSGNFSILLLGRLISALGAGLCTPLMFNLIVEIIPRPKWGFFMGIAGLVISMAPTLGPAFGGAITYYLNWRFIFLLVSLLAALVLALGSLVIGKYHDQIKASFDWSGFLSLASGLICLILAINFAGEMNLIWGLICLVITIVCLGYFGFRSKNEVKLIDLAIFHESHFIWGLVAYFFLQFINIGISFVVPNYLQIVNHQTSLIGGLVLVPGSIVAGLLNPYFGRLYDNYGGKLPLYSGAILVITSCLLMTVFGQNLSLTAIILIYGLLMLGHRMSFSNTLAASIKLQLPKVRADATAVCQTFQQLAGSLGTSILAIIITLFQKQAGSYAQNTAKGSQVAFGFSLFLAIIILISDYHLLQVGRKKME